MSRRALVAKTYKLYLGGAFVRSESGRSDPTSSASGDFLANVPRGSRKDVRDAVKAARGAAGGWAGKTAYNRGQVLYRFAEALESRSDELARAAVAQQGVALAAARAEVATAVDTLVHYAGWTDKLAAVMGGINPVAAPYLSFSAPEPTGVVAVLSPDEPDLLGLVRDVAPALAAGNTVVAVISRRWPLRCLDLGEIAAVSDPPGRDAEPAVRAARRAAQAAVRAPRRQRDRGRLGAARACRGDRRPGGRDRQARQPAARRRGGRRGLARAPGSADRAQDRLASGRQLTPSAQQPVDRREELLGIGPVASSSRWSWAALSTMSFSREMPRRQAARSSTSIATRSTMPLPAGGERGWQGSSMAAVAGATATATAAAHAGSTTAAAPAIASPGRRRGRAPAPRPARTRR
jgi:hypothetical protein